jgi:hypothetical protein
MDYEKIGELAEREHVEDANKLLKKGWAFVKAAETMKLDQNGHQFTVITYVLGRLKRDRDHEKPNAVKESDQQEKEKERMVSESTTAAPAITTAATTTAPTATIPDILSLNIQWRQKKDQNPNFYYAFVNTLDGKPDPVVAPVVEAIKKNDGTIIQNGWRFTVKNQFLQRGKVKNQSTM